MNIVCRASKGFGRNFSGHRGRGALQKRLTQDQIKQAGLERDKREVEAELEDLIATQKNLQERAMQMTDLQKERLLQLKADSRSLGRQLKELKEARKKRKRGTQRLGIAA